MKTLLWIFAVVAALVIPNVGGTIGCSMRTQGIGVENISWITGLNWQITPDRSI